MRLRTAAPLILGSTFVISLIAIACGDTTDAIIQTTISEQKAANRTATAEALVAKGEDPSDTSVQIGKGSLAERVIETQKAQREERAEASGSSSGEALVELPSGEFVSAVKATQIATEGSAEQPLVAPDGPAESGEVLVQIITTGKMVPAVIKITVGTTVTWENQERTGHSTRSDPDQAEVWDSESLARGPLDRDKKRFSHTFTIPGRYTYGSRVFGDSSKATVFVVEE